MKVAVLVRRIPTAAMLAGLVGGACQPNTSGLGGAMDDVQVGGDDSAASSTSEPATDAGTTLAEGTTQPDPGSTSMDPPGGSSDTTGAGETSESGGPPDVVCENLLVNPSAETGNLEGWNVFQWGEARVAQESAHDGTWSVRTSYQAFMREQQIDLVAAGLDPAFLDGSPDIVVEEWVQEIFAPDHYWIQVELRDEFNATLDTWSVDDWTTGASRGSYDDDEYFAVGHTFSGYPPGVRSVLFRDGGQDGEFWAGTFGVVLDAARVEICHPR